MDSPKRHPGEFSLLSRVVAGMQILEIAVTLSIPRKCATGEKYKGTDPEVV